MSSNLLKGHMFSSEQNGQTARIIDSNSFVNKRLTELAEKMSFEAQLDDFSQDEFTAGIKAEDVTDLLFDESELEQGIEENGEELLERAKKKAEEILDDAKRQAENVLNDSINRAEQAKIDIYNSAKEQGYEEGFKQAQLKIQAERDQLQEQLQEAEASFREKEENLEEILVDTITDIYSHIFSVGLDDYRGILLGLIRDTLHNVGGHKEIIIRVSPDDFIYISSKKKDFMEFLPSSSVSLEVLDDPSMSKRQCMIETENGIYDCGLDTQLEQLRKKLMLLSYNKESMT